MLNQSDELVAEYVCNGLGHRIGVHYDVNADGQADLDDVWYWFAYDDRWRIVATFRDDDDEDPKEVFVYHAAGLGGYGGSSYIDAVILRDRDVTREWEEEATGILGERIYYCQNWRHDVVALITEAGHQVQQMRYSAYGVPIGLPAGDANSDGSVTAADEAIVAGWFNSSTYDVRGDLNLDGVVDLNDRALMHSLMGNSLGWGALSLGVDAPGGGNRKGYAGYEGDFSRDGFWHVRFRVLDSELGRWTRRDPLGDVEGPNVYAYAGGVVIGRTDPLGTLSQDINIPTSLPLFSCDDVHDWRVCGSWKSYTTLSCIGFVHWWYTGCDCILSHLPDIVETLELITVPMNCEDCRQDSDIDSPCPQGCKPKDRGDSFIWTEICTQFQSINIGPGSIYSYPCPCTIHITAYWNHQYKATIGVCTPVEVPNHDS